jgi:hypothetical protein
VKPLYTACEKCRLREVRHELERHGVVIKFCDECYWGEISEPESASAAPPQTRATGPAACGSDPEKSAMLPQGSATQDENSRNGGSNEVRRGKRGRIFFGAESP